MFNKIKSSALRIFRDELIGIVNAISPSIVTVRIDTADLNGGTGSGWFYEPGIIVTNNHVIEGDSPIISVRLKGGKVISAEIVGSDPLTDLAVLRCDETTIEPLPLNSDPMQLGELCFAFGSPLGEYTESVTFGVISGLGRRMPLPDGHSIENLIQIDAEINPGNSGGPLIDLDGEVLGVNVMIRTDGRGMGFAIPASTVASIVPELLKYGEIVRPRLGVSLEVIEHNDGGYEQERVRVASSPDGHPLQPGDVLLAVANSPIGNRADLFSVLRRPLIAQETQIEIERNSTKIKVIVVPDKV